MPRHSVMEGLFRANYHKGGLKCQRLFRVEPAFFAELVDEVRRVVERFTPSSAGDEGHVTNWTRPYGKAIQYSLLNHSGRFDDYSTDHDMTRGDKSFHYADDFPALARFIESFPFAYNMRLNGMGRKSGLSPHEEHIVFPTGDGRSVQMRARYHLPIRTSERVEMLLDGEVYRFEAGSVYLFNNGCIHSATNEGDDFRYHLVWDEVLTRESYLRMFDESARAPDFLRRATGEDAVCRPLRRHRVREYAISGMGEQYYHRFRLDRLGIKPNKWQNLYNELEYWKNRGKQIAWWDSGEKVTVFDDPAH